MTTDNHAKARAELTPIERLRLAATAIVLGPEKDGQKIA